MQYRHLIINISNSLLHPKLIYPRKFDPDVPRNNYIISMSIMNMSKYLCMIIFISFQCLQAYSIMTCYVQLHIHRSEIFHINSLPFQFTSCSLILFVEMANIYKALDFFGVTNLVYKVAGWHYNLNSINLKSKIFQEIYYWFLNTLYILIILQSLAHLFYNIGKPEKFLEVTEMILVIGFIVMLIMKSYFVVYRNRKILTEMIDDLDEVIPKAQHVQAKFNIEAYYKKTRLVSIVSSITYSSLLIIFNVMPILEKITGFILGTYVKWELPFKFYFPFDATQDYVYPIMYIYETWLCGKCAVEVLGSDLLFCNITSLITMRLEMLRHEIVEIDVENHEKSLESLKDFVKVHQHLKKIVDKLEKLYSFSLLGDLIASTIITCLAAFNAFVK